MLLLDENEDSDTSNTTVHVATPFSLNKFKLKCKNFPDLTTNPQAWAFLRNVVSDIKCLDITPKENNLIQTQRQTILKLQNHSDLVIKDADKGGNIVLRLNLIMKQCVSTFCQIPEGIVEYPHLASLLLKTVS